MVDLRTKGNPNLSPLDASQEVPKRTMFKSPLGYMPNDLPPLSSVGEEVLLAVAMEEKLSLKKRGSPSYKAARERELPEHLVCPISRSLMADPVIIASGHSYERICIQLWFQRGYRYCFKSGLAIEPPVCIPNLQLGTAILVWCNEHKVPRPRVPSHKLARDLLERSLSRAAVYDGLHSPSRPMWFANELDDQQPGFFADGSGSSEILETSGDESCGLSNNGTQIENWNDDRHIHVEFTGDEGQRWQDHDAGLTSRRRDLNHQSRGLTTRRDLSPPRPFRAFRETPTDALVSQNRDQSHQRQQYRESIVQCNDVPGLRPTREYHSRDHTWSQGQDRSSGSTVQTPLRVFRAPDEDVRNQPCFGLADRVESNSDEVPDSRYARSAMGESHTDGAQTSEEFSTNGISSPLATKLYFSHSDEVVLDQATIAVEDKILRKLRHKETAEQEKGATELRYLTREVADYQLTLCTPAVLTALVQLLQSKHAGVQSNVTAAIMNLSLPNKNKAKIVNAGTIPHILEVLKSNARNAHVHAAGVLFSLVTNDEIRTTDRFLQAIPPLIDLLESGPLEAQHDAAMALYHLSSSQIYRTKLIQAHGVPILLGVVAEESSILARIALLILSKLAAAPEGHDAICEANGVKELVNILALRSLPPPLGPVDDKAAIKGVNDWASVREHTAAVLLRLSHENLQFKTQALHAGAIKPLVKLAEHGTKRAKIKAVALLQKIE